VTTKAQRREEVVSRLDELKREDWPRFSLAHLRVDEPGTAGRALLAAAETPENAAIIGAYLRHFVPGECPWCGYGMFGWGLVHGSGSCSCSWPGTLYHFIDLADGSRLRVECLLWAHPYDVHAANR
jgi:hypothetical protein